MPRVLNSKRIGKVTIFRYKRDGSWYVRYSSHKGRQQEYSLQTNDKSFAESEAKRISYQLFQPLKVGGHLESIQFKALVDLFQAQFTGWSDNHWQRIRGVVDRYKTVWGDMTLDQLTFDAVGAWLAGERRSRSWSASTYNRHLSTVRTIMKFAYQAGFTDTNTLEHLKHIREQQQIPEPLSDADLEALRSHLKPHVRDYVDILVLTGLRRQEAFTLAWSDVDLEARTLVVRQSKAGDFRVVPLATPAVRILERMDRKGALVFGSTDYKKSLINAGLKASIGHVHNHRFRHTFATRLLDRGVPIDRVQRLLGHKTLAMTLRYARTRQTALQDAIATLDDYPT